MPWLKTASSLAGLAAALVALPVGATGLYEHQGWVTVGETGIPPRFEIGASGNWAPEVASIGEAPEPVDYFWQLAQQVPKINVDAGDAAFGFSTNTTGLTRVQFAGFNNTVVKIYEIAGVYFMDRDNDGTIDAKFSHDMENAQFNIDVTGDNIAEYVFGIIA